MEDDCRVAAWTETPPAARVAIPVLVFPRPRFQRWHYHPHLVQGLGGVEVFLEFVVGCALALRTRRVTF
ncbi:hypothetical protein, partial [Mycoplasmoides pneumoniae]|uniref:hypothetical protein n=1 Tax=Mycoplasmoides pneumoniae TaxID=2104 RepID=UPI001330C3FA